MTTTKSVLTIHNMPFSGPDITGRLAAYGLPLAQTDLPEWAHTQPLPLGIWAADRTAAVSPTYAEEILTPEFGAGLDDFLRGRENKPLGILNGIDTHSFDPATDEAIALNYTAETLSERKWNKAALQQQLGLEINSEIPLFGIVSRMEGQKGIDLAIDTLSKLKKESWQAVILGTGDRSLEARATRLQKRLKDRVRVEIRYDARFARRIYSSADMFLMPSRYEPCGLSQMVSMRYGCVPIVHSTGGLKDTVRDGETGFIFEEATVKSLLAAMRTAMDTFKDTEKWQKIQKNGMAQDFSWAKSAKQYAALYNSVLSKY